MKKRIALCSVLLFCICLTACTNLSENGRQVSDESDKELRGDTENNLNNKPLDDAAEYEIIIRDDAQNLVKVHIENGKAKVFIDAVRFEQLYGDIKIEGFNGIYEDAIEIITCSGFKIVDAIVAQIPELSFSNGIEEIVTPVLFLLMEDGSVEWAAIDLFLEDSEKPVIQCISTLMWIDDIVSFSYQSDNEGMGDMTIYAYDFAGSRFDLRIPVKYMELSNGSWICDMYDIEGYYLSGYYGVFTFSNDNTVVFEKGWIEDKDPIRYIGTYELSISDDGDQKPGILYLDLTLDPYGNSPSTPKKIKGSFFTEMSDMIMLELWHSDGDSLHTNENVIWQGGTFWLGYSPFSEALNPVNITKGWTSEDYVDYLISRVAKANVMLKIHGMSVLVTDEFTNMSDGYSRNIWLGSGHPEQFVREILYTISDFGSIYEYDPVFDSWIAVWQMTSD